MGLMSRGTWVWGRGLDNASDPEEGKERKEYDQLPEAGNASRGMKTASCVKSGGGGAKGLLYQSWSRMG